MEAATVRAFIASLEDRPADRKRMDALLQSVQRPDVRYLVGRLLGGGSEPVARVARAILEAAGAPTGVLAPAGPLISGAALDDALLASAGTFVAGAAYQLAGERADLGELTRREAEVALALVAFAQSSRRAVLLLDEGISAEDPLHAPEADLVVIGRVDRAGAERALALVPDGRPAVAAPQSAEVRDALEQAAKERGIPLLLGDRDFSFTETSETGAGIEVRVGDTRYDLMRPRGLSPAELATGVATALALGVLGIRMREEWVIAGCGSIS
ncbi:MAG: hypothetical protein HY071_00440 [Chloroflexi bacterium]|nr:hypothetical protein [Chloroflexota bacterium]